MRDMALTAMHFEAVVCGAIAVVAVVAAAGLAVNWWMLRRRGLPTERTVTWLKRCIKNATIGAVCAGLLALWAYLPSSVAFGAQ